MAKNILTMEQLIGFCQDNSITEFSAKKFGQDIAVSIPATFSKTDGVDDDNGKGLIKIKFRLLHEGENLNHSYLSHDSIEAAKSSLEGRPVLAYIHQLDDGTYDFGQHEVDIVDNDDGTQSIIYIEKQVGSITADKPWYETDEDTGKTYLCVTAVIPELYTEAANILMDKGGSQSSVELSVSKMSYDFKTKCLHLDEWYVSGVTLLGKDNDGNIINAGMAGCGAQIVSEKDGDETVKDDVKNQVNQNTVVEPVEDDKKKDFSLTANDLSSSLRLLISQSVDDYMWFDYFIEPKIVIIHTYADSAFCADKRTLVRLSADTRRYERTNMNCLAYDGTRTV